MVWLLEYCFPDDSSLSMILGIVSVTASQQHLRGMRRVFSGSQLANSQNWGLTDPVLGAEESLSVKECYLLSQSAVYSWCCSQFSKLLLNRVDDDEDFSEEREKRQKQAADCIGRWQVSGKHSLPISFPPLLNLLLIDS